MLLKHPVSQMSHYQDPVYSPYTTVDPQLSRAMPIVRGRQHSPSPSLLKASSLIMRNDFHITPGVGATPERNAHTNRNELATPQKGSPHFYNGVIVPSFDKRISVVPYYKPTIVQTKPHIPIDQAMTIPLQNVAKAQLSKEQLLREMQRHCEGCGLGYRDPQMGVYGRRCSAVVLDLWYEPIARIFQNKQLWIIYSICLYLKEKPGRHHCQMIQNAKKSFYLTDDSGVLHEYFYDSYEGWYIRSYFQGFKVNYTSESSSKYRQCDMGLELNTQSYKRVMEEVGVIKGKSYKEKDLWD